MFCKIKGANYNVSQLLVKLQILSMLNCIYCFAYLSGDLGKLRKGEIHSCYGVFFRLIVYLKVILQIVVILIKTVLYCVFVRLIAHSIDDTTQCSAGRIIEF